MTYTLLGEIVTTAQQMGPMPKMVIDENIKTVIVNGNLNRNGPDWVHVVLLEEEMVTLNPPGHLEGQGPAPNVPSIRQEPGR